MEQLDYNLLYRWFVGLDMDEAVWDVTVFTKNRERLLKSQIADGFFEQVLQQARGQQLLSADHFTVDGTLIEAWAGQKDLSAKTARRSHPRTAAVTHGRLPRPTTPQRYASLDDRPVNPS